MADSFTENLSLGAAKMAHCWLLRKRDGAYIGFSDHDRPLEFDGHIFHADSGLTGAALENSLGLSVDNSEAVGALRHKAISHTDIVAGKFDNAAIKIWLVNWENVAQRLLLFKGNLGEIELHNGEFKVELRSQMEQFNQPRGRIFQKSCSAILGDAACGVDVQSAPYSCEMEIDTFFEARDFYFQNAENYADGWFLQGRMLFVSGEAKGLEYLIVRDRISDGNRIISLSQSVRADIRAKDTVRLIAGCDKRAESCKLKFRNFANFRGFPHLPDKNWMLKYPKQGNVFDGGKLAQ